MKIQNQNDFSKNDTSKPFLNPVCVALDLDDPNQAISMASELAPYVGGFKLGPRLIHRRGESIIQEISKLAPVFVDCKFFDIPSTMVASVRASFEAGASVVTVHALSGAEALHAMAKLEKEYNQIRPFKVLAVTILTSWSEESFPPVFKSSQLSTNVISLAKFVKESGLNGIVCSGEELKLLDGLGLYCVTPGVRLSGGKSQDQKRIITPQAALKAGANVLVIGRPILESMNPVGVIQEILTNK